MAHFSILQPWGTMLRYVLCLCSSNIRGHQEHLKSCLKYKWLNLVPRNSDSVDLRWDPRFCLSNMLPGDAEAVLHRPPFENHCSMGLFRWFQYGWTPAAHSGTILIYTTFPVVFLPFWSHFFPFSHSGIQELHLREAICSQFVSLALLLEELDLRQGQCWLLHGFLKQPPNCSACHLLPPLSPSRRWPDSPQAHIGWCNFLAYSHQCIPTAPWCDPDSCNILKVLYDLGPCSPASLLMFPSRWLCSSFSEILSCSRTHDFLQLGAHTCFCISMCNKFSLHIIYISTPSPLVCNIVSDPWTRLSAPCIALSWLLPHWLGDSGSLPVPHMRLDPLWEQEPFLFTDHCIPSMWHSAGT